MSLLSPRWIKQGPGIAKDAPAKQGFALLADVIARNWWELIQLNLLVVLFSLPLVTFPAALAAAACICVLMLEDRPLYLGRDFIDAFRRLFWRATALGAMATATVALAAYASFIFLQAARANIFFALPMTVSICTGAFALIVAGYAFGLLAIGDRPLGSVIRRSLLGAMWRPLPVLAALGVVAALWLIHIMFYPASIFMPAVVNFSFGMLAVTFGAHKAAARLLALDMGAASNGPRQRQAHNAHQQREGWIS